MRKTVDKGSGGREGPAETVNGGDNGSGGTGDGLPFAVASGEESGGGVAESTLQRVGGHPTIPPRGRPAHDGEGVHFDGWIIRFPSSV